MYYVVYYRCEAGVTDLRAGFKTMEELSEWFTRQQKLEPTIIIGIYDKDTKFGDIEKDQNNVMKFIKVS